MIYLDIETWNRLPVGYGCLDEFPLGFVSAK